VASPASGKEILWAIAEAMGKNNRRIQPQLVDSGIDAQLSAMSEPPLAIRPLM